MSSRTLPDYGDSSTAEGQLILIVIVIDVDGEGDIVACLFHKDCLWAIVPVFLGVNEKGRVGALPLPTRKRSCYSGHLI